MTLLALSIEALNAISLPLELFALRVTRLPTFELVISLLSVFLIASLKVSVMFESLAILVAKSVGL